jgi:hypothetical protein
VKAAKAGGKSFDDAAKEFVTAHKRIDGFGHPQHPEGDPRTKVLFGLAEEYGVAGDHIAMTRALERALAARARRPIPANIDATLIAEKPKIAPRLAEMKAVLAKRHTDRPTRKAPPTKLRPHVACGEKQKRIGSLVRVKEFRWQYRDAQKRFADGEAGVVFPRGTYRMKHLAKVHIGKCPRFPKDELMKHIMRIPHDAMADAS